MKLYSRYIFLILFAYVIKSCASNKAINSEKNNITVKTFTYKKTSNKTSLDLDFYSSKYFRGKQPLIIYVHGGGFSSGKRNDAFIKKFTRNMAKKGIAVASISYRLTMKKYGFSCNTATYLKINAFNSASEDISLATKFLIEKSDELNIDTSNIILMGSSAGAEAVLNLTYVYNNTILPNFKYAGVIAMAGAITTVEKITENSAIPTMLFHGVKDKLVPYNIAPHHYCKETSDGYLMLYGAKAIAEKLKELNKSFYLYTVTDGNHSWNAKPMILCVNEILDFINTSVIQGNFQQKNVVKKESSHNSKKS
ncbi:MAG: alpha/beta hydrolase [Flavobacteriaceae bacterium]|nr:alpha/beta hydrolase [Flavobacteriaceae bacterium]